MDLTDSISTARSNLSGIWKLCYIFFYDKSKRGLFDYMDIKELVIKYALDQHRQDLISILEAPDQDLHYAVVVQ